MDVSRELSAELDVWAGMSISSIPGARGWVRRVLLAPGRVFFLAVLSLMELCGLPKVRQLPSSGQDGDSSPERAR